jgi:hypothetical protein
MDRSMEVDQSHDHIAFNGEIFDDDGDDSDNEEEDDSENILDRSKIIINDIRIIMPNEININIRKIKDQICPMINVKIFTLIIKFIYIVDSALLYV